MRAGVRIRQKDVGYLRAPCGHFPAPMQRPYGETRNLGRGTAVPLIGAASSIGDGRERRTSTATLVEAEAGLAPGAPSSELLVDENAPDRKGREGREEEQVRGAHARLGHQIELVQREEGHEDHENE